ncbi:MAG: TRAP transporter small permease [Microvirga sp.]|jgi:TRAP-type transport system small permease protein
MAALLTKSCDLIAWAAKVFIGALVGAIVVITLASVWWRYVLNAPLAWPEQVSRILFVWITFVGAAVLYRERLHVAIDMFMALLPRGARRAVGWAIELLILAFNFVLLLYGLKLSVDTLGQTFGALDITPASFYFAAPVAAGMMILYFLERISTTARRASIEVRAGAGSSV